MVAIVKVITLFLFIDMIDFKQNSMHRAPRRRLRRSHLHRK